MDAPLTLTHADTGREPVSPETAPSGLVLVIVGGHLRAELGDRAAATGLACTLDARLHTLGSHLRACVVTDLWQLNDDRLAACPAVCVGAPAVNAATASIAGRVPSVLSAEGRLVIQLDLTYRELTAACWGATHTETASACILFAEKYAEPFARAAARLLADAEG
ncbi:MAG: hypothetical protein AAGB48_03220 [Planctomycetota bacterium]